MTLIAPGEITFVVQGPVDGNAQTVAYARTCIDSIRSAAPQSKVILSTYTGSDVSPFDVDEVVYSVDPGGFMCHVDPTHINRINNTNRQITTSLAGLKRVTTKYAVKVRSDLRIKNTNFIQYIDRGGKRRTDHQLFSERVVSSSIYCPNPWRWHHPALFHPSDWFFFGATNDLLNLFDVPLANDPDGNAQYFLHHEMPQPCPEPGVLHRYNPEQYLMVTCIRKHFEIDFEYWYDFSSKNLLDWELFLSNNFVVASPERLGFTNQKLRIPKKTYIKCFTHADWLRLCKKHCDQTLAVGFDWELATYFWQYFLEDPNDAMARLGKSSLNKYFNRVKLLRRIRSETETKAP